MPRSFNLLVSVSVALNLMSFDLYAADEPKGIELFNGKDLTGWGAERENEAQAHHRYSWKQGVLVVHPGGKEIYTVWTTGRQFPMDFELRLEFRAAVNADSGLLVPQASVERYASYLVAGPYKNLKKYKAQDWNEIVVVVKGTVAHCTCNGEVLEEELKVPSYRRHRPGGRSRPDGIPQYPPQGNQVTRTGGAIGATLKTRRSSAAASSRSPKVVAARFQRADLLDSPAARHVGNVPPLP